MAQVHNTASDGPGTQHEDSSMANADSPPPEPPTKDELKHAFKAFKKRLKLIRLDADSQISASPLTSGRDSGIVAIQPPGDFSQAVWDELVRRGKLKPAGHGTYELGEA